MQLSFQISQTCPQHLEPVKAYTFLCDHTGQSVPFWLDEGMWRHYTQHPLWNESRIYAANWNHTFAHILPDESPQPWLPLLRKLIFMGYQHQSMKIDYTYKPYYLEVEPHD